VVIGGLYDPAQHPAPRAQREQTVDENNTAVIEAEVEQAVADEDDLVVDELLVEEISIDGMCGVY
jgi:mycofactocin precursor